MHAKIVDEVSKIPGLLKVRQVRLRPSGPYTFVDMILDIPRNASFEEAHSIGVQAKAIVNQLVQRADVIIHMDPMVQNRESVIESVRSVAARNGVGTHSIRVHESHQNISLEMHVEVPESLSVSEAHDRVTHMEAQLRQEIPSLADVVTHIEPLGDKESRRPADSADAETIRLIIQDLPTQVEGLSECHNITIYKEDEGISVSFHCTLPPSVNISQAHKIAGHAERKLKSLAPEVDRVYIHVEPPEIVVSE
jgi:divalent metal cation (Fe/Co/Zn/Cd) transporter